MALAKIDLVAVFRSAAELAEDVARYDPSNHPTLIASQQNPLAHDDPSKEEQRAWHHELDQITKSANRLKQALGATGKLEPSIRGTDQKPVWNHRANCFDDVDAMQSVRQGLHRLAYAAIDLSGYAACIEPPEPWRIRGVGLLKCGLAQVWEGLTDVQREGMEELFESTQKSVVRSGASSSQRDSSSDFDPTEVYRTIDKNGFYTKDFEAEKPSCFSGEDGTDPSMKPFIHEPVILHFDPPHPILKGRGTNNRACDGKHVSEGRATGVPSVVNCQACRETEAFQNAVRVVEAASLADDWRVRRDQRIERIYAVVPLIGVPAQFANAFFKVVESLKACERLKGSLPHIWERPEEYQDLARSVHTTADAAREACVPVDMDLRRAGPPNAILESRNYVSTIQNLASPDCRDTDELNPIVVRLLGSPNSPDRKSLERMLDQLAMMTRGIGAMDQKRADHPPGDGSGSKTVTFLPAIPLTGWSDIFIALNESHGKPAFRDIPANRNTIRKLNDLLNGPIVFTGVKGSRPEVSKGALLEWWLDAVEAHLDKRTRERGQKDESERLTVAAAHSYGTKGTVVPEIGGSVKKGKSRKR